MGEKSNAREINVVALIVVLVLAFSPRYEVTGGDGDNYVLELENSR